MQKILTSNVRWLVIGLVWVIVYFTDWVTIINNDFIQTVIGLILFLMPGTIFILLYYRHVKWTQLITQGFIVSSFIALVVFGIVLLGNLSSSLFHTVFSVIGTLGLFRLIQKRKYTSIQLWEKPDWSRIDIFLIVCAILSVFLLSLVMTDLSQVDGDYMTYNAMVTEFAESPALSLQDPFLGTDSPIKSRLWLVGWVVNQALIVQLSGLNILESFHHINVLLALLVHFAIYDLLRRFGIPFRFAMMASIFTVLSILTQLGGSEVGRIFIERLAQDKVMTAWLIAPIFLRNLFDYLTQRSTKTGLFLLLISFVTVNFHAVIYFYMAVIAGGVAFLYTIMQSRKLQDIVVVGVIVLMCASIPFALRQTSPYDFVYETTDIVGSGQQPEAFARLSLSDDKLTLYGISSDLTDGVAFIVVFITTIVAIIKITSQPIGYIVIASTFLLLVVVNPITTPIVGKLVSPFQLWRITWVMPFGIAGAFLLYVIYVKLLKVSPAVSKFGVVCLAIGIVGTNMTLANDFAQHRLENITQNAYSQRYELYNDLVDVGDFLQHSSDSKPITVFADNPIMYLIPSISSEIHALIWHNNTQVGLTQEQIIERELDHNRFYAEDISIDEFHNLIDKYDIHHIILSPTFNRPLNTVLTQSKRVLEKTTFNTITLWKLNHDSIE